MAAERTYLDHNATAPLRPQARAAVIAALDVVGNASSVHAEGRRARELIENAREAVATLLGAKPEEVVFTSGATEANNWVIRAGWDRLSVGPTEHESVLTPARAVGAELCELECDDNGLVHVPVDCSSGAYSAGPVASDAACAAPLRHPADRKSLRSLISLQLANSETGVLQPIAKAVETAHSAGFLVHCDAVQAAGRMPVNFKQLGLDFLSISAHKLGGPKGIGALLIRDGLDLQPHLSGGGQERRRRAGTENVAAIAGFGAAAAAAHATLADLQRIEALRDRLEAAVEDVTPEAVIVGARSPRLPNTSCIALPGADASTLLIKLDLKGVAVSAGSACSSGKIGGSHVLTVMGLTPRLARAAIRISLGWNSDAYDVERFIAAWKTIHSTHANNPGGPDRRRPPASAAVGLTSGQAGE